MPVGGFYLAEIPKIVCTLYLLNFSLHLNLLLFHTIMPSVHKMDKHKLLCDSPFWGS